MTKCKQDCDVKKVLCIHEIPFQTAVNTSSYVLVLPSVFIQTPVCPEACWQVSKSPTEMNMEASCLIVFTKRATQHKNGARFRLLNRLTLKLSYNGIFGVCQNEILGLKGGIQEAPVYFPHIFLLHICK